MTAVSESERCAGSESPVESFRGFGLVPQLHRFSRAFRSRRVASLGYRDLPLPFGLRHCALAVWRRGRLEGGRFSRASVCHVPRATRRPSVLFTRGPWGLSMWAFPPQAGFPTRLQVALMRPLWQAERTPSTSSSTAYHPLPRVGVLQPATPHSRFHWSGTSRLKTLRRFEGGPMDREPWLTLVRDVP
jgi:hypothetical protein